MQRLTPGATGIQAATWNKFADTSKAFLQAPPQTNIKGSRGAAALRVQVENQTGGDITADFPVVEIGNPIFTTADRADVIHDPITLQATTPDASTAIENIAIVQGPIPDGEFRPAVIQGVSYVKLYVTNSQHQCALPIPNVNTALQSGTTGIKVVWHDTPPSYPAYVDAIVDLGKASSPNN